MNNDLSFWRKLMLELTNAPKTDADIAYLYRNIVRPGVPASALWDAEKGAEERANTNMYAKMGLGTKDFREKAILNRGLGINQTDADIPEKSPTGRIMQEILGDSYLFVPKKQGADDFWSY